MIRIKAYGLTHGQVAGEAARERPWERAMTVHPLDTIRAAAQTSAPEPAPPASPRRRRPWGWAMAAVVALCAGGAVGWALLRPPVVAVALTTQGPAVDAVYASGVVEYVRQARVAPVVTAPIVRVMADEGQDVRAGQPLAQLDDGPQLGATLQLAAQAAQARAAADRAKRLFDAGFGAKVANDDAQTGRQAAEAAAASAQARLKDYRIQAPFAGRILRRDAEPGDLATIGQPMFVIADLRSVRVTADVDERDVGRLAVGQDALVRADAFPGQTFQARVSEITPQGDSTGRVFRVRLSIAPSSPLKPGMTVETNLVTGRREHAVLVPTAALSNGAVWVAQDGRARRLAIRTGAAGPDRTEAQAGLAAGQRVILNPPKGLKDGARISVRTGA